MGNKDLFADMPDQTGKVVIVTGGNTGIGKATCQILLSKGAKVYMGARDRVRAEEAIKDIKNKVEGEEEEGRGRGENIHWLPLDLSDMTSVRTAAQEFVSKETHLHTLYNNAGIMATPYALSPDGIEMQWATNVVGHFTLTKYLLPVMQQTSSHLPPGTVRIINVSSQGHQLAPGIMFDDIGLIANNYASVVWRRYGQSKLGNILMTNEIARRYTPTTGIYSLSVHPGVVHTNLIERSAKSSPLTWITLVWRRWQKTCEQGAYTQLFAGTSPLVVTNNLNGTYLVPYAKTSTPSKLARDAKLAERMWNALDELVTSKFGPEPVLPHAPVVPLS